MKTIIFYGRTQVGTAVLSYLVAKGYKVKVIPEDDMVRELCGYYGLEMVTLDTMGEFDLFICCHGEKIIPERYLIPNKFINMHSCLWKYKGKDPIKRYIANGDTDASIESHYMVKEIDAGEVIDRVLFNTPVVKTHGEYFNIALPYYYRCINNTLKKIMKTAAITRFRDDLQALELWFSYYSKYFDDLYVLGCEAKPGATDPLMEKYPHTLICDGASLHSLPAQAIIKEKQEELLKTHDWVLYSDMDEFIVPTDYKDLRDYMLNAKDDQPYSEGYEVYQAEGELPIDYTKPYLKQRKHWVRDLTGSYNKPLLSRVKSNWTDGFHKLDGMDDETVKAMKDTGLILVHTRWGDPRGENYPERISVGIELAAVIPDKIKEAF